jgi:glycosyltransferase involved in cell wall biosynthesis
MQKISKRDTGSSDPLISVIVPTCNRLSMLKRTLSGLWDQTYPRDDYEIIVVDDGSEDETPVYLEKLAQQGELRYLRQSNQGPAAARNAGARAAHGELLAFTDDDCLPDEDWLRSIAQMYRQNSCDAVGGYIENYSDGNLLQDFYIFQGRNSINRNFLYSANASYRSSIFWQIGGYNTEFLLPGGEDVDLGLRLTKVGYKIQFNPQAVVLHSGPSSITGMLSQSYRRGKCIAFLLKRYPKYFEVNHDLYIRQHLRSFLDRVAKKWQLYLLPERLLLGALVAALHRLLLVMAGTIEFALVHFRQQLTRYIVSDLTLIQIFLYSLLAWGDHMVQSLGQVVGTFDYTYRRAK